MAATSPRRLRIRIKAHDWWPASVRGVGSEIQCSDCGARLRSRTHAEARKALRMHRLKFHTATPQHPSNQ